MTDLSDAELDGRLRAVGLLLDETAAQRAASLAGGRRRRPRRPLVLAAAVLVVVAIGAAAVLALRSDGSPEPDVLIDGTTTTTSQPTDLGARIRALGLTGEVISTDVGLVDLATGEITPMASPADVLGVAAPTAASDGEGGLYYLSYGSDPDDPDDFGRYNLRHLAADDTDVVVQADAHSFALKADGTLAMAIVRNPDARSSTEMVYDVVVEAPDGARETWSPAPGGFQVAAWAGDRLIAEREIIDSEARDGIVFDGPGQVRDLGGASPGPDGTWAIVGGLASAPDAPQPGEPPRPPSVLDLATGEEIGTLDPGDVVAVPGDLAWAGDDRLLGASAVPDEAGYLGVVVDMAVSGGNDGAPIRIDEQRSIVLDDRTHTPTEVHLAPDGTILAPAMIIGAGPGQIAGWGLWACAPGADICELKPLPFGRRGQVTFVDNPSRPLP